jgi:cell filamentation protein
MTKYPGHDPYVDPVTGVLKSRLGIIDPDVLEQTEAAFVATRSYELAQNPLPGSFDLAHLRAIHRHLFGDLYEWAGELRTVDISKDGHLFALHDHLQRAGETIFQQLADEKHLTGLDSETFSKRAAHYLGELNALHPFREGNGRTQREFISHLAQANGYYIAWENVSRQKMLEASIESFQGDTSKLADIIRDTLSTLEREGSSRAGHAASEPRLSIDEMRSERRARQANRESTVSGQELNPSRSEGIER